MPADFQTLQARFAAHLRHPGVAPAPPQIENRRLQIYRDLFFNTVDEFLSGAFPVLRQLLPETRWRELVRDFYHRCHSAHPQLHRLAEDFVAHVARCASEAPQDWPPAWPELAHYEWVELALGVADVDLDQVPAEPPGDWLDGVPVLSPLAWLLAYEHPVHTLGPGQQNPPASPTYLVVNRQRNDEIRFLQLDALGARLLQRLEAHPQLSTAGQLDALAGEAGQLADAAWRAQGLALVAQLAARDVLLGVKPRG